MDHLSSPPESRNPPEPGRNIAAFRPPMPPLYVWVTLDAQSQEGVLALPLLPLGVPSPLITNSRQIADAWAPVAATYTQITGVPTRLAKFVEVPL